MKATYYPGCSLHSTAAEYHDSISFVCKTLGVELVELDDWNCCGASCAHATNHYLATALPLRNLIIAEQAGNDVIAPCAACYNMLRAADRAVRAQDCQAAKINDDLEEIIGARYGATIETRHPLEVFGSREMLQRIGAATLRPLKGLRVVTYYGCLLTRPKDVVAFDNPEHPVKMDKLLTALGAEVKRWSYKTECCGGALALSRTDAVAALVAKLVTEAGRAGAQAIVSACPLCQVNLDTRQTQVVHPMPIFYFTELMGLAFGAVGADRWLRKHIIDPAPVLAALAKGE
ncbi:CoB--CoM heterodisulfide reductase iron-sulfur subunit B family protein [Anaeroselena agilis]|uniref:CoB--CoM heterodisulfide reductase iron-sulfur subunit B family protein n=1 Tax=Anaeroselena agilis TaxID=3063788 RepID=A0ABU3P1S5_9FIRM|nr:CoB--CoM heterodisulfide reductase iron-sulfur subunit B family protein [Selenomonadales bacterium 4137-cl]